MAEVNIAYKNGDESKLQSILADWESSPESVEGEGVGPELIRVIRKIAQIRKRLSDIEAEIQQLNTSDQYQLRAKADEAENQGRDLLKDMGSEVVKQIVGARERLVAAVAGINADL